MSRPPLDDRLRRALDEERAKLAARLDDPGLLDGAVGMALERTHAGHPQVPWSGLAVPLGGTRVCGYVQVPRGLLASVLYALEVEDRAVGGFSRVRVRHPHPHPHSTHPAPGDDPATGRVEWGVEPDRAPEVRARALGYTDDGVAAYTAEHPEGCR
ncbi:DUF6302 family protein [Streptomyces sp. JNUCC 64]